eukprot:1068310-Rhodomonas_salina.2
MFTAHPTVTRSVAVQARRTARWFSTRTTRSSTASASPHAGSTCRSGKRSLRHAKSSLYRPPPTRPRICYALASTDASLRTQYC